VIKKANKQERKTLKSEGIVVVGITWTQTRGSYVQYTRVNPYSMYIYSVL